MRLRYALGSIVGFLSLAVVACGGEGFENAPPEPPLDAASPPDSLQPDQGTGETATEASATQDSATVPESGTQPEGSAEDAPAGKDSASEAQPPQDSGQDTQQDAGQDAPQLQDSAPDLHQQQDVTLDAPEDGTQDSGLDVEPDSTVEAAPDTAPPVDATTDGGEDGIASLGTACSTPQALACTGHAQTLVLICDPGSLKWLALQTCSGLQLCDTRKGPTQGTCQDAVPACVGMQPGAVLCDGATRLRCGPDLITSETVVCNSSELCQASTGMVCAVCLPNQHSCVGAELLICKSDKSGFESKATCATAQLCNAGAGECTAAACLPGQYQCNSNQLESCNAAQTGFTFVQSCGAGLCDAAGKQCDSCQANSVSCENDHQTRHCSSDGQTSLVEDCPTSTPVCLGQGVCAQCAPGTKRCQGLTPQSCDGTGNWSSAPSCSFVCSAGECIGECVPGSADCQGTMPRACDSAGHWIEGPGCPYLCNAGVCEGECVPGSLGCAGNTPQTCSAGALWQPGAACSGATPACDQGKCVTGTGPSCAGIQWLCGATGTDSCCGTGTIPGGSFLRSYDNVTYKDSSYPATVSGFRLELYEVSVGRFRRFWESGGGTQANPPAEGAGAHPAIPGSGWQSAWNVNLTVDSTAFKTALACHQLATFSTTSYSARPINCLTWYEAMAFCAWDGGRLVTEAEWNYAAAGGDQQRVYPWSQPPTDTTINETFASYWVDNTKQCYGDGVAGCSAADILAGGSKPAGYGRWGQADLAGNLYEWVLDGWKDPYASGPCNNCAYLDGTAGRVGRGGSLYNDASYQVTARRLSWPALTRNRVLGARCARMD